MALTKTRRIPPQLNDSSLQDLALRYVGKYATTRAKLRAYLSRKVRERGWEGPREPDFEALSNRFVDLGYIDDAAYALAKSRSLTARGYGERRVAERLQRDGVEELDGAAARGHANKESVTAALRFAERRKFGPFASSAADPQQRQKWIGAMIRAGHGFDLSRAIAELAPNSEIDVDWLAERSGRSKV